MTKKNSYRQRTEDMKLLISEANIRNNLKSAGVAKKIGMKLGTFNKYACHPEKFRCDQLWLLEELAGRTGHGS